MDQPSSTESNALTLRIRFKSASLEEFIGRYAVDVSPGGIFIRTKQPVEVGTVLQFDFSLADGSSLLSGLGTVAWVREHDPARANSVPGMGLRFDKLTPDSQQRHQAILAEKARKDGKPLGTPYPPTSFVVPPPRSSPSPDSTRTTAEATALKDVPTKQDVSPVPPANFAKTLPAPAAALAARMQQIPSDSGEFDAGGKTEISAKPIEDYLRDADAPMMEEDSAPKSPLEDWKTDAHDMVTASGGPPAPEEVAVSDSQAYATEVPAPPPSASSSGERRLSGKQSFEALLDLGDTVENQGASQAPASDSSAGVPSEFPTSEKTEEVSFMPQKASEENLETLDLNASMADEEPVPSLAEVDEAAVAPKRRSVGVALAAIVLAAAAAFAAVYLLQTKPWQKLGAVEGPEAVVKKLPTVTPTPVPAPEPPPAAAPAEKAANLPAAAEGPVAKIPAGKETAVERAAARKAAAEKAAAEKAAAEKAAAEKAAAEKAAAAKTIAQTGATASRPAVKPGARGTAKTASETSETEKTGAAGVAAEEVYRMVFRSSPYGAEVLIDGEYYARTPCERRILDPKKLISITVRKAGYEPFEHMVGPSDHWAKRRNNERVLTISVRLKKAAKPAPKPAVAAPETPAAADDPEPQPAVAPTTDEPEPEKVE